LLGAATAIREAIGEPVRADQRDPYDTLVEDLREQMGESALTAALQAGQALAREDAIAEALALLEALESGVAK
jgi:hypothetical protein